MKIKRAISREFNQASCGIKGVLFSRRKAGARLTRIFISKKERKVKKGFALILVGLLLIMTMVVMASANDFGTMTALLEREKGEIFMGKTRVIWIIPEYYSLLVENHSEISGYLSRGQVESFLSEINFVSEDNIVFLVQLEKERSFSCWEFWQNCYLEIDGEKHKPISFKDSCSFLAGLRIEGILTFANLDKEGKPLLKKETDELKLTLEDQSFFWNLQKVYGVIEALSK